jgi:MFS family permease
MGAYFGFVLALTLDLQVHRGFRPLGAALAFVPYSAGFATVSLTWTRLSAAGRRRLSVAGPVAFAVGVAGFGLLPGSGWPVLVASPLLLLAGAGHAATYSPLVGWVVERVGPGYASAVSALTTTAPPLAAVVSYAGIGGLYLTAPPGTGPARVGLVLGVILVTCLACVLYATSRRPRAGG